MLEEKFREVLRMQKTGTYLQEMYSGERRKSICYASSCSNEPLKATSKLPVIKVTILDQIVSALVDAGCSAAVLGSHFVNHVESRNVFTAFDGWRVRAGFRGG